MIERPKRAYYYHLPQRDKVRSKTELMYLWAEAWVWAVALALLVGVLLARGATISGQSMAPTLRGGQPVLILELQGQQLQRGDIIAIDRSGKGRYPIVKRIIGLPGDEVNLNAQGQVFRNGTLLEEPYTDNQPTWPMDIPFPVRVPEGYLLVLGDNRRVSVDSRSSLLGMVDARCVMGKVLFLKSEESV